LRALVIGAGAREHALGARLYSEGWQVTVAPGNPGLARSLACRFVDLGDLRSAVTLAREVEAELVVVGPEGPLIAGLADALRAARVAVFGPSATAARVEGSKAFGKELMAEARIPTARHGVFEDAAAASAFAAELDGAVAVKADGIAAGKGVVVCAGLEEAQAAVRASLIEGAFGEAGRRVIVEERLSGPEVSLMALCDGRRAIPLPLSHDYKRVRDGDLGPNTGGMGAVAPSARTELSADELTGLCITPLLDVMRRRGMPFEGLLYAGLMLTPQGPRVLEYNCRFGDPETQVLMAATRGSLGELMLASARGSLPTDTSLAAGENAVGVVACAEGYPQKPRLGDAIEGLEAAGASGASVFFAGVNVSGSVESHRTPLLTSAGRVLTLVGRGNSLAAARAQAYAAMGSLRFRGLHYRHDIGLR
jgi:phosphoribosylamine---glycine ligase